MCSSDLVSRAEQFPEPFLHLRIATLVARGTPVLAYGSHVRADLLRAAREAGARAVPNSEVEERLRELLGAADPGPAARG